MAYVTGTADSHLDLMTRIKEFAEGKPTYDQPSFAGTGTGELSYIEQGGAAVAETWTITCTTASAAPATTALTTTNGDAETNDMTGWSAYGGYPLFVPTGAYYESGSYSFEASAAQLDAAMFQQYDLVADGVLAADLDNGSVQFKTTFSLWNSTDTSDYTEVILIFRDSGQAELGRQDPGYNYQDNSAWTQHTFTGDCPVNTRYVDVVFFSKYTNGTGNTNFIDNISADAITHATKFSVSGSVSGAQPDAYSLVRYTASSLIDFTISDDALDFATSDAFTLVTTTNTLPTLEEWTTDRWKNNRRLGTSVSEAEWLGYGPGTAGTDQIHCGIKAFRDVANNYYYLRVGGNTGYSSTDDWHDQPGGIHSSLPAEYTPISPTTFENIQYWIVYNGRRIIVVQKMGSVYETFYIGFIKTYSLPSQYPYPMFCGASVYGTSADYTNTDEYHSAFWNPTRYSNLASCSRLRGPANQWQQIYEHFVSLGSLKSYMTQSDFVWPYYMDGGALLRDNLDGTYPIYPVVLMNGGKLGDPSTVYGEMDGVHFIPGHNLSPEDIVQYGGDDYLMVPNVYRTGDMDFAGVRLK